MTLDEYRFLAGVAAALARGAVTRYRYHRAREAEERAWAQAHGCSAREAERYTRSPRHQAEIDSALVSTHVHFLALLAYEYRRGHAYAHASLNASLGAGARAVAWLERSAACPLPTA
jgi:hypothetical protein